MIKEPQLKAFQSFQDSRIRGWKVSFYHTSRITSLPLSHYKISVATDEFVKIHKSNTTSTKYRPTKVTAVTDAALWQWTSTTAFVPVDRNRLWPITSFLEIERHSKSRSQDILKSRTWNPPTTPVRCAPSAHSTAEGRTESFGFQGVERPLLAIDWGINTPTQSVRHKQTLWDAVNVGYCTSSPTPHYKSLLGPKWNCSFVKDRLHL